MIQSAACILSTHPPAAFRRSRHGEGSILLGNGSWTSADIRVMSLTLCADRNSSRGSLVPSCRKMIELATRLAGLRSQVVGVTRLVESIDNQVRIVWNIPLTQRQWILQLLLFVGLVVAYLFRSRFPLSERSRSHFLGAEAYRAWTL